MALEGLIDGKMRVMCVEGCTQKCDCQGSSNLPNAVWLQFASAVKVPTGGVLYLKGPDGVPCSSAGWDAMRACTLKGISFRNDIGDAAQAYDVEVVKNPDGTPSVIGTLAIPATTRSARRTDLNAAIAAGDSFGVRITRTSGASASEFTQFNVLIELAL